MKRPEQIDTSEFELVSPEEWRDRFLRSILIGAAVFGLIALIPAFFSTPNLTVILVYTASFVTVLVIILAPFPYQIRAAVFLFLVLAVGISDLLTTGMYSDADLYLLAFAALTALLLSPRAGIIAIAISIAALVVGAIAIGGGFYQVSDSTVKVGNLADWATVITTQLLLSIIVVTGLRRLQFGFTKSRESLIRALRILEDRDVSLVERTKELEKKTDQLNAAAYIARQAAEIKDLNILLPNVVQLISKEFGFYHAGIFLITEKGDYAVLQAASSEGGKQMLERGHRLRVGAQGIVGFVSAEKRPRIALDVGADTVFFDNPELPDTRSEIAVPLIVQNKLIGVLDVQSTEAQAFNQDDVDLFQTLADQIAIAIENARLLTESQLLIERMETLSKESDYQNWRNQLATKRLGYHYSQTGIQPLERDVPAHNETNTLVTPILFRGQKIGKITLQRKANQPAWTNRERQVTNEIAIQTALALDNARLIQQTRESAAREQTVAKISSQIRETLDLETVLRTAAQELQRAFNLQEAEVRLSAGQDALPDSSGITRGEQTSE